MKIGHNVYIRQSVRHDWLAFLVWDDEYLLLLLMLKLTVKLNITAMTNISSRRSQEFLRAKLHYERVSHSQ